MAKLTLILLALITLLSAGAAAQSFESGHRKLPLSSLSQPAYEPTKQPTSGGRCSDDSSWCYDGGDKDMCEAEYGQSLEAIDLDLLDDNCYCQNDCQCLCGPNGYRSYVATRRSITELPPEC